MLIFSTNIFPLSFSSLDCTAQFLQFFLAGSVFMPFDYLNFSPLYFPQLVNLFPELKSDPPILVEASLNKVKVNKVEGLFRYFTMLSGIAFSLLITT